MRTLQEHLSLAIHEEAWPSPAARAAAHDLGNRWLALLRAELCATDPGEPEHKVYDEIRALGAEAVFRKAAKAWLSESLLAKLA